MSPSNVERWNAIAETWHKWIPHILSDEQARIWNEVEDALGAYMTPAGFEVQHHVLVACGGKP
jgi:hypothetical protein